MNFNKQELKEKVITHLKAGKTRLKDISDSIFGISNQQQYDQVANVVWKMRQSEEVNKVGQDLTLTGKPTTISVPVTARVKLVDGAAGAVAAPSRKTSKKLDPEVFATLKPQMRVTRYKDKRDFIIFEASGGPTIWVNPADGVLDGRLWPIPLHASDIYKDLPAQ